MKTIFVTLELASLMVSIPDTTRKLCIFIDTMEEMNIERLAYSIASVFPGLFDGEASHRKFMVVKDDGKWYADIYTDGLTVDDITAKFSIKVQKNEDNTIKFSKW